LMEEITQILDLIALQTQGKGNSEYHRQTNYRKTLEKLLQK
jgi:hypothetical protein